MKFLLNLIPTLSFLITYKFYDIFVASFVLIIISLCTFIITSIIFNSINKTDVINLVFIIIFGFLTIFNHNGNYIKWKITIIYLLIFFSFLINYFFMKKTFLQMIFEKKIKLSQNIWKKLSLIWSIFFLICASINTYVLLYCSEQTWVTFKVFGLAILTLLAAIISGLYIQLFKF